MKYIGFFRLFFRAIVVLVFLKLGVTGSFATAPQEGIKGPRLADEQFFSLLDYSRPELEKIRKAVDKQNFALARELLSDYIRKRATPHWTFNSKEMGKDPGYNTADADKAMVHLLRSIGIDWQFGERIDWSFNPTTQPGSKWPRNHEWTWQLSRHPMWNDLSRAFYATGNEKYARELVLQMESWITDCPVPLDKPENVAFSRWRTIEAGIRMGTVWPDVFFRILPSKSLDADAMLLMLKSFVEHAQYLMKFPTKGNWLTMETNGLYHVGAIFPEFKEAANWRDTAVARLYRELDIQVYPDGAQIELAPGYHGVSLRNFLGPVKLIPLTGFNLPADYLNKLEKMFAYFLYSSQPGFRMPPLNDSGSGDITGYMTEGFALFPQRSDFQWAATHGASGKVPGIASCEFPYAGQFIMRSGWDQDARWLLMDGGPFGFGHQHEDKLSILLTAFGKSLLTEGGVYTYDASDWRRYVLGSYAHNIVLVDGLEQNRRKSPGKSYVILTPLPHIWETNSAFDHSAARYDEGYGPDAICPVKQTRHVFFLKPDLYIVTDQMVPLDNKPHTYEALFHLDAPDAQISGMTVRTTGEGPILEIKAMGADEVRIVKGQKEPYVQGWIPDNSAGYGGIRPIPTAIFKKEATGDCTILYILWPSKNGEACPVANAEISGKRLYVKYKDGSLKSVQFNNME
jgi:hypothetical protein